MSTQNTPISASGSAPGTIRDDILSGLTVALALVPEAVAFAFVAGIPPTVGLYGAIMMGFITSLFGGRPGMISGATGAMARMSSRVPWAPHRGARRLSARGVP